MRWQGGCRAYGGGRTIRQGEALESEEVAQARKQRIAEALSRYKQTSGTIVDSSVEAAAQVSSKHCWPVASGWNGWRWTCILLEAAPRFPPLPRQLATTLCTEAGEDVREVCHRPGAWLALLQRAQQATQGCFGWFCMFLELASSSCAYAGLQAQVPKACLQPFCQQRSHNHLADDRPCIWKTKGQSESTRDNSQLCSARLAVQAASCLTVWPNCLPVHGYSSFLPLLRPCSVQLMACCSLNLRNLCISSVLLDYGRPCQLPDASFIKQMPCCITHGPCQCAHALAWPVLLAQSTATSARQAFWSPCSLFASSKQIAAEGSRHRVHTGPLINRSGPLQGLAGMKGIKDSLSTKASPQPRAATRHVQRLCLRDVPCWLGHTQ